MKSKYTIQTLAKIFNSLVNTAERLQATKITDVYNNKTNETFEWELVKDIQKDLNYAARKAPTGVVHK